MKTYALAAAAPLTATVIPATAWADNVTFPGSGISGRQTSNNGHNTVDGTPITSSFFDIGLQQVSTAGNEYGMKIFANKDVTSHIEQTIVGTISSLPSTITTTGHGVTPSLSTIVLPASANPSPALTPGMGANEYSAAP